MNDKFKKEMDAAISKIILAVDHPLDYQGWTYPDRGRDFLFKRDPHSELARKIFDIPPDQPVSKDQRAAAKEVAFAETYGRKVGQRELTEILHRRAATQLRREEKSFTPWKFFWRYLADSIRRLFKK